MKEGSKVISLTLLSEADSDPNISGYVKPDEELTRIPIEFDNEIVGFATPRQDKDEVWRMGAIFIKPSFRGKKLGSRCIRDFMQNKKGRAYIEHNNIASQKSYERAGFKNVGEAKDKNGCWWQNF